MTSQCRNNFKRYVIVKNRMCKDIFARCEVFSIIEQLIGLYFNRK